MIYNVQAIGHDDQTPVLASAEPNIAPHVNLLI